LGTSRRARHHAFGNPANKTISPAKVAFRDFRRVMDFAIWPGGGQSWWWFSGNASLLPNLSWTAEILTPLFLDGRTVGASAVP
jgi:hypothetical protein